MNALSLTIDSGIRVVVTAAGSLIGRATTELMLSRGAQVLAIDSEESALGWLAGRSGVDFMASDLTTDKANQQMIELAASRFGGLDALILCTNTSCVGDLVTMPWNEIQRAFEINIGSMYLGIRNSLPLMRKQKSGSILAVLSGAAISTKPVSEIACAHKAAVIDLVKTTVVEAATDGIRINAVCPGIIQDSDSETVLDDDPANMQIPIGRPGRPGEVAEVIAFLCSEGAAYINGAIFPVDGGYVSGYDQFAR